MIIKKFVGKNEEEAVAAAKKELGEGVVIMNVKQVKRKGLLGLFRKKQTEVTVALEEEPVKQIVRGSAPSVLERGEEQAKTEQTKIDHQIVNRQSDIEKKLDSLQTLLESQLKQSENPGRKQEERENADARGTERENQADKEEKEEKEEKEVDSEQDKFVRLLYNTMLENEMDEKYANQILEDVEKSRKPNMPFDYILANIYQKIILKFGKTEGIRPAEKNPRVVFFIGPTGVGKTTTIAKLASQYAVEEKKKTALLTTDTYRIAAAEQLRTYAGIMEVPFRVIYTEEELREAVTDFREYDYIFVDTAGHSHQNDKQMGQMKSMLTALQDMAEVQIFLVLSATTKYRDLLRIADKYREISDYELIFTKLDETFTLGNLLNLKMHTDTPIAYVTCGQNVPEDIEKFNAQKVVKQILGGKA